MRNKSYKTKANSKKIKLRNWKITQYDFFFSRLFNFRVYIREQARFVNISFALHVPCIFKLLKFLFKAIPL
jgi:hypothetical protein